MINHGYHMGANGVEITLDIEKYGELVERDKMAINLFFTEVYPDKIPNVKDKNKIKKIMQSKEDWEARESLRFGKSIKRGFAKIKIKCRQCSQKIKTATLKTLDTVRVSKRCRQDENGYTPKPLILLNF